MTGFLFSRSFFLFSTFALPLEILHGLTIVNRIGLDQTDYRQLGRTSPLVQIDSRLLGQQPRGRHEALSIGRHILENT